MATEPLKPAAAPALPDAEALCARLIEAIRPAVGPGTAIVGVKTGGAWLAERVHAALGIATPLGVLDISFYRDDYATSGLHHNVQPSRIPFDVNDRHIIVVDDVLYTGRTVRAAMNELFDYGRPAKIEFAALIDRGERQLPIAANYIGATLAVPGGRLLRLVRDEAGRFALKLSEPRAASSEPKAASSEPKAAS